MGRNRKTTAEHLRDGTLNVTEHAGRMREPSFSGAPVMPKGLPADVQKHWRQVVPELIAKGVAKAADPAAVIGRESPLGYIARATGAGPSSAQLWLVGSRRSDTLLSHHATRRSQLWLVGSRRSDTLEAQGLPYVELLWLVGSRRSDTFKMVVEAINVMLWLVGSRRSDTLKALILIATLLLWLVGSRRSDTLPSTD